MRYMDGKGNHTSIKNVSMKIIKNVSMKNKCIPGEIIIHAKLSLILS